MGVYNGQESLPPGYFRSLKYFPSMYQIVQMLLSQTKDPVTTIIDLWISTCCPMIYSNYFFQAPERQHYQTPDQGEVSLLKVQLKQSFTSCK